MNRTTSISSLHWRGLLVFVLFAAVLGVVGISRLPAPWVDEVFYAEPARTLATEGRLASPMFMSLRGIDQHFFLQPPGAVAIPAAMIRLFGFSKLTVRLPGVFEYCVAIVLVFLLTRSLLESEGRQAIRDSLALLAACFFAFDPGVNAAIRSGRPDLQASCLVLAGCLCLIRGLRSDRVEFAQGRPSLRYAAAGLFFGGAAMSHPTQATAALGAFTWIVVLSTSTAVRRVPRAAAFAIGCVLPVLVWVPFIAEAPELWRSQFVSHLLGASTTGSSQQPMQILLNPLRQFRYFALVPLAGVWLVVSAIAGRRGLLTEPVRPVLAVAASLCLLLFTAESFVKFIVPLLYPLGAAAFDALLDRLGPRVAAAARASAVIAVITCAVVPLGRLIAVLVQWQARSEEPIESLVAHIAPGQSVVAGSPIAYYASVEHGVRFIYGSPLLGVRLDRTDRDWEQFAADLIRERPAYFLLPSGIRPAERYAYLPGARFTRVASRSQPSLALGPIVTPGYDVTLWSASYQ